MTSDPAAYTCDELADLAPAVALHVAEPEVVRAVEAHAEVCPACGRSLDELREMAAVLALDSPQVSPSPALKERVLSAALRERPARVVPVIRRSGPRSSFGSCVNSIPHVGCGPADLTVPRRRM